MTAKLDLTGMKFGKLTVQYENGSTKQGLSIWHCLCDCGNECDKVGSRIVNGYVKSCGCYAIEIARKTHIKENRYDLSNEYGIGYDCNNKEFFFDIKNYAIIKDYCWRVRNDGYVDAKLRDGSGKRILMHVLICDTKNVDHIGGKDTRNDNRECNLRVPDISEYSFETFNNMNKRIQSNNKSGYPGVIWHKRQKKWNAYISVNKKKISLGSFDDLDDAIAARKAAEDKYFGEFSYDNSQKLSENNYK